jgi:Holliday junction DNA helicase RuvA
MIAKLTGRIDAQVEDGVIIDVNGVGYLVACSSRTLSALPGAGEVISLMTEFVVREDRFQLFGFRDGLERDWFRVLQTVQGVGAKVALAILSVLSTDELARAVAAQDRTMLSRAAGVGPKLAQRIVNELKDRAPAGGSGLGVFAAVAAAAAPPAGTPASDAVSALVNLGYRPAEASGAVAAAARRLGDEADLQKLITAGLRELAK